MSPSQLDLFSQQASARFGDPETSHKAARSVHNQATIRDQILSAFRLFGPMTDEALLERVKERIRCTPSGVRTRRSELVAGGLVVDTGSRAKTSSGREAIVWRLA